MYKTRNVFIFHGSDHIVRKALDELKFKGTVTLIGEEVTEAAIQEVFYNNKSALCYKGQVPSKFENNAFHIVVSSNPEVYGPWTLDISRSDIIKQFQDFATANHLDLGDHVTNSSGLKGAPSPKECAYCNFLIGKNPYNHKIVYKANHFYVQVTLGEFIFGYVLLIPFHHVTSLAELTDEEFAEIPVAIDDVSSIITNTFNCDHLLIFENGSGNGGKGKAKDSIVHSHLHFIPSKLTASKIAEISGFKFEKIHTSDIRNYGAHSYLLIKDEVPDTWFINSQPSLYIPRQYVRQLVANEYGIPGERWNWRKYGFTHFMERTTQQIAASIFNDSDKYSTRILERTQDLVEHYYG